MFARASTKKALMQSPIKNNSFEDTNHFQKDQVDQIGLNEA